MERMDDASVTEMTAFVKNLLATVRKVVGFLEGVQGEGDGGGGAGVDRRKRFPIWHEDRQRVRRREMLEPARSRYSVSAMIQLVILF